MTDCKCCSAMREEAAKVVEEMADLAERQELRARASFHRQAVAAIRALPCQCPPLEGGLTREQIEWHKKLLGTGVVSDPEFVKKLCDMALRQCPQDSMVAPERAWDGLLKWMIGPSETKRYRYSELRKAMLAAARKEET